MASGFGFQGGRSRCYTNWQEFMACYSNADAPSDCVNQRADYLECLHHTKEVARNKLIAEHFVARQHREAKAAREAGEERATGSIMRLGLVPREEAAPSSSSSAGEGDKTPPPKGEKKE